jgi:hypothetical protein
VDGFFEGGMFEVLSRMLGSIAGIIKDAPGLIAAVGTRMDNKQRIQAIQDLRVLNFSPNFRMLLSDLAEKDFTKNPAAVDELVKILDETAVPVGEAVDRLIEFGEKFADLPYDDFESLLSFLDGKTKIRKEITKRIEYIKKNKEGVFEISDQHMLEEIQYKVYQINKSIGQVHETLRLVAKQEMLLNEKK